MSSERDAKFETLAREQGEGLFRFLYWSLGNREDARDAVQETLLRAYLALAQLRSEGSLRLWLYRIAANVAHDARAKRQRRPKAFGMVFDDEARAELHGSAEPLPIADLVARETSERLAAALAKLPPELHEPLVLHAVFGLKYREVAEAIGSPIGTVTARIHDARIRLQRELEPPRA